MEIEECFDRVVVDFLKKHKGKQITHDLCEELVNQVCEDFFKHRVYFEKYPTRTGKQGEDLTIIVPRPMKHLFKDWKVRVTRLKEHNGRAEKS